MSKSKPMRDLFLAVVLAASGLATAAPASAQIPGILPSVGDVEPSAPLPIDGMWTIREIDKRIMIENGYAYAVDSWVHALIFRIMPDQIIIRDITPVDHGLYVAQNLPMQGEMTLEAGPRGTLVATMRSGVPGTFHFDRVIPDHVGYPEPGYGDDPGYDEDPGYEDDPYPPAFDLPDDRSTPEDPDAGEAPVNPWAH